MTVKVTKALTKTATKPAKVYKDIAHSDITINEVKKLVSLNYKNKEIAKMLDIRPECVSKMRNYLKRHSWSSTDLVKLARTNIKEALIDGNLALSEKVFDHANKQHAPAVTQQQQPPSLTVNVGSLLDELSYRPSTQTATREPESHVEPPSTDKAPTTMREGEIVE